MQMYMLVQNKLKHFHMGEFYLNQKDQYAHLAVCSYLLLCITIGLSKLHTLWASLGKHLLHLNLH